MSLLSLCIPLAKPILVLLLNDTTVFKNGIMSQKTPTVRRIFIGEMMKNKYVLISLGGSVLCACQSTNMNHFSLISLKSEFLLSYCI